MMEAESVLEMLAFYCTVVQMIAQQAVTAETELLSCGKIVLALCLHMKQW